MTQLLAPQEETTLNLDDSVRWRMDDDTKKKLVSFSAQTNRQIYKLYAELNRLVPQFCHQSDIVDVATQIMIEDVINHGTDSELIRRLKIRKRLRDRDR